MSAPMRLLGRRTGERSSSISKATSVGGAPSRRAAPTDALTALLNQVRHSPIPCGRWLAGFFILHFFSTVHGAAPVEESVAEEMMQPVPASQRYGATAADPPAATTEEASPGASQLGQLFYQLQLLRDEVQRLNGALEEQQNQIERLAREQHERYLGLDRRVAELSNGALATPSAVATVTPDARTDRPSQQRGGATTERGRYESAYAMMQRQEYEAATETFQGLIGEFPNGQYTPNAYYWLGELHRKRGDPEAARQSFVLVVNLYPDHGKVPDALYKLGVVYTQLDDPDRALAYLDRVLREYPDSTAASLAKQHADELR